MMNLVYDRRLRRRALFVLGNLTVCVLVVSALVMPIRTFFVDRDNHIADQSRMLARLSAIAAQAANVRSVASEASAQMRGNEFLTDANENLVSASLQTRLKAAAETAGAKVRAVQALPIRNSDQIRYSGSRIELVGPLPSIRRAVYAIEGNKPYLFISGATIKILSPINRPNTVGEPNIEAQLDVFGAMQITGREP